MTKGKVLVTGASGFLGSRTVEILSERGFSVRALVRNTSRIGNLKRPGVEIFFGDVSDISTLKPAFEGIDFVVHTAADTSGTREGAQRVTIGGTRKIFDLCTKFPVQKLIYISSCSVYGLTDCRDGQIIDENGPLERYPERRGIYSWSKIEAEKLVRDYMNKGRVPVVCLRPGTIYGPGGKCFTPMMGFSFGNTLFVVIGPRNLVLPLVYIDNLIDAIVLAIQKDESVGNIYNVIDMGNPTKQLYVASLVKRLYPEATDVYLPLALLTIVISVHALCWRWLGRNPVVTRYQLISSQKAVRFVSDKITRELGWARRFSYGKAVDTIIQYEHQDNRS